MSDDQLSQLKLIPVPTPEQLEKADAVSRYLVAELQRNSAVTQSTRENLISVTEGFNSIKKRHDREDWFLFIVAWIASLIVAPAAVWFIAHVMRWTT